MEGELADRLGFEPKTALRLYSISSAAPSTGLGHLSVSEKSTEAVRASPGFAPAPSLIGKVDLEVPQTLW